VIEEYLTPVTLLIAIPLLSAAILAAWSDARFAPMFNVLASLATFFVSLAVPVQRPLPTSYIFIDDFNVYLVVLTTFVAFTTSWFSASYIDHEVEAGRLTPVTLRFYHAMYQLLTGAMIVCLVANNIVLMWVALEAATITTVVMVSLYRTRESIEAAWKYFILASVGIALALFGTILIYLAARPHFAEGIDALAWTQLRTSAGQFDANLLNLAFVFLLVGYGTKIGLAPLHAWLPDAHAEGPTPISAVLSGLLLNVALYAVLRFKMILTENGQTIAPGRLMLAMGIASLLLAAVMLYRRRDIKRFFAYSSIEHMGLITFAFGVGGPLANFAGLFHMTLHSLTKSAIFYAVGHISQIKGTRQMAAMGGLTTTHPWLGWGFVAGVVAIAGLPPLGLFMSEFLILSSAMARQPWLAVIILFGLAFSLGALILRVQSIAFGEPKGEAHPITASLVPLYLHVGLVLVAGLWLPPALVTWFQTVAGLLGE
jgi:hydrogenase-4 component F